MAKSKFITKGLKPDLYDRTTAFEFITGKVPRGKRKRRRNRGPKRPAHLSPEYIAYMRSPAWKMFRLSIIAARGRKCEECGWTKGKMDVHHLHYRNFMHENPEDVQILCIRCHGKRHPDKH